MAKASGEQGGDQAAAAPLVARLAGWAGATVRWCGLASRSVPGVAGVLLVSAGAWEIYRPAGLIAAGVFALAVDRTIP